MAQLLIKALDASHPDPEKDKQGCYKKGDVVRVEPDDHVWGAKETTPTFVIVQVPGDVSEFMDMVESDIDLTNPEEPITKVRRKLQFDPKEVDKALKNDGGKDIKTKADFDKAKKVKP